MINTNNDVQILFVATVYACYEFILRLQTGRLA